ncbi:hypothetical protein RHGRI_033812 [Rhododendron griersonianum]|uniref:Retrotransposon gag domain-containing protein n=1 Tax=Rhododendron griersonianum TaxID=479676 RepID=A0AAV6I3X5_9ERIC|nr:hypothetical protein RHGRI_033812 [Rhododendron griersonianum]
MQQNQSLLMETVLALQKKSTTSPTPQAETEGTHPTGSQTETRDNQIGEGAQNLQSKETPTPPLEISSQKILSMGLGVHSGDRNLRLRKFSKSLTDKTYSWYANLAPNSVLSWEDMVKKFYSKFFYVEDRLTTLQLMKVTQRPSEDLNAYVRRFCELSVDV